MRRRLENTAFGPGQRSVKYLFVCGSQRTGTTITAELLGQNGSIALGIERFLLWECDRLGPGLFTKKRFFNFRTSDTIIDFVAEFDQHYASTWEKFDDVTYVGDKLPHAFRYIEKIDRNFGGATFVFTFRNVYEVAASFNARLIDPGDRHWSPQGNHILAASTWNESLRNATIAKESGHNVIPCGFAELTDPTSGRDYYCKVLEALGLPIHGADIATYKRLVKANKSGKLRGLDPKKIAEVGGVFDERVAQDFGEAFGVDWESLIAYPADEGTGPRRR